MSAIQNLLDQFLGGGQSGGEPRGTTVGKTPMSLIDGMPGGFVGGAAAGGIVALLLGNKKARKFAGKAAGYGGAAVLGGVAYSVLQDWRSNSGRSSGPVEPAPGEGFASGPPAREPVYEIALVKAMVAAAKADGHIDAAEQERIFRAVNGLGVSTELKALVFDLLTRPIPVEEIAEGSFSLEQKSELYLASCLAIDVDDPREATHLAQLAHALGLPPELALHLGERARQQGAIPAGSTPSHLPPMRELLKNTA